MRDRRFARPGPARRARRADGRRRGRRRDGADPAQSGLAGRARCRTAPAGRLRGCACAEPAPAGRYRALLRRGGGSGRGRNRGPGGRRGGAGSGGLRAPAGRDGCAGGHGRRRAAALARLREQSGARLRGRRPRGGGGGLRGRGPCRDARKPCPPRQRRAHGAAQRRRRIRRPHGVLHPARRLRARRRADARAAGGGARRAAGEVPGRIRRHGRQFRHEKRLLARIRAHSLGGEAHRAAGKVDGGPPRMLPERLSGPRPPFRGGAGARRGRQFPGAPGREHAQSRRLHGLFLATAQGPLDDAGDLPDTRRPFPGPCGAYQHGADRRLSQRRPARGHLHDRAADRPRGRRARLRPGRTAPAEPDCAGGHAVHQRGRRHL